MNPTEPRWLVVLADGAAEQIVATDYELHDSGAVTFTNRDKVWVNHVITFAPRAWRSFFPNRGEQ